MRGDMPLSLANRYELDTGKTLIANIPLLIYLILGFGYIFASALLIAQIDDKLMQFLTLIAFIITTPRVFFLLGEPSLQFKPRMVRLEEPEMPEETY